MKNFQNLYEVTKTLRFELKPGEETFKYLSSKNTPNELAGDIKIEDFFEQVSKIFELYSKEINKVESIVNHLIKGDKTQVFIIPDFAEKLYKYSFNKKNVSEPKKLGKKIQRLTFVKGIDGYLENFKTGNIKKFEELLRELKKIIENYKNGKGQKNTEIPKKVEILQIIRKLASIYLKTYEIFSQLEIDAVLRDEYNQGKKVTFLPELKEKIINFFALDGLKEKSEKYLKTLTGERGLYIGSFSLNKYAVNNFKEISEIEEILDELKIGLENKKQEKFEALQVRETAYWEKWNELVDNNPYYSLLKKSCPKKGRTRSNYKKKLKNIKKEIYNNKIQSEAENYKRISKEYGDIEKEYISLQRELEEVSESKYFGRIIKESNDVFYLALTERLDSENKKKKLAELDILQNNFTKDSDLGVLEFYKLSFPAFEKLCLLKNSTLGVNDTRDEEIRELWEKIKYKRHNVFRRKKYQWDNKKTEEENLEPRRKFESRETQEEFKKQFEEETISNVQKIAEYFAEVLEKHPDLFQAKFDTEKLQSAETFKEFERLFNEQGYKISKNKISKNRLLHLAKNGEILLFQIFCKDFVLDKNFALTDFDKTKIGFKSTGKDNSHTRYWKEFFENIENVNFWNKWRLYGDGKLFFREKDSTKGISRRYKDDKYFVSLGFQIYPNAIDIKKEVKYDKKFQKNHIKDYAKNINTDFNPQYVIGLDQGVNSLVSYCVIDTNGNIIKDENGKKAELGDLSLVISKGERQGEFVEVEDTLIVEKDKAIWNDEEKVLELSKPNERVLKEDNSIKVFDYTEAIYAESYKRRDEVVNYQEGEEVLFDEVTDLKKGYASYVLHKIEQLAKKYSPAIIALEYMQDTKNKSNFIDKKGEGRKIEEQLENSKTYRFGTSTVEAIEDALLEKFRYWNGKVEKNGNQLTPYIVQKSCFYKKNTQWGNIVFVDEENTSSLCPKCNQKAVRCKDPLDKEKWKQADCHSAVDVKNIYGQFRKVKERVQHKPEDNCNWNSTEKEREFSEIRNGDDLASYNIAKRGLEFLQNNQNKRT